MFTPLNKTETDAHIEGVSAADVERILRAGKCSAEEIGILLSPVAEAFLPQMAELARKLTLRRFGKTMQVYAPVYLSNYCSNNCVYCGFAAKNKIVRKCLSEEEIARETEILYNRGFRQILLVTGEANKKMGVHELAKVATDLKERFSSISIEVQPFDTDDYKTLFAAGVTGVAVYQETYQRDLYAELHLSGKKTDYDYRLATPARACAAGMREVGIGALLGLGDWRFEGINLAYHLQWLRRHYWQTAFTVSFPRMRPASGGFEPAHPMSARELSQLIFALRILDPDVGLLVSTREEVAFRDGMVGFAPTRYSAGSSTTPGGYGDPDVAGEQWDMGDNRSVEEVIEMLLKKGFDPVYKDWDSSFQSFAC
ncbi:2-iminoacetate synthase ThiH [Desulfotalea psychrophila]|uniref:Probable thiazole biosynthesis protein ThiH n=1 Tax=Desulfotalea psychrophila (strain LSv54 / DSM 12343) TaxID=177439 RepID=Q6AMF6_DESPS|nr:2-iminoacetate synthase ThiH [Desulfotalea psychrophila]CAG36469.1 probable thiazole biosynthesis protein ThiH [Desulfotalea psychrophila LSv54]